MPNLYYLLLNTHADHAFYVDFSLFSLKTINSYSFFFVKLTIYHPTAPNYYVFGVE